MALPDSPLTRTEQYLNRIATGNGTIPDEPLTRLEQYLDYIAENGGGGGESVTVDTALSATSTNPVQNKAIQGGLDALRSTVFEVLKITVVGVKYKAMIDGSSGAVVAGGTNRETSDFIDVSGYTSMTAVLNVDNPPFPMWFAVRCYDANKAFLGAADPSGTVPASRTFTLAANTAYIRLMFTPDTSVASSADLKGVYTGHTITISFTASGNTVAKTYYLEEVEDF